MYCRDRFTLVENPDEENQVTRVMKRNDEEEILIKEKLASVSIGKNTHDQIVKVFGEEELIEIVDAENLLVTFGF